MLKKYLYLILNLFLLASNLPVEGTYINRFSGVSNGSITYTGNTIGLSKAVNLNDPGIGDSFGAFITTDEAQVVNSYPSTTNPTAAGTTLTWQDNSSSAILDLPTGSTVLYAELIWSGSYGFQGEIPYPGNPFIPDITSVSLTDPHGTTSLVAPDPATSQETIQIIFPQQGVYVRSQIVTSLIQAGGAGSYTVGGIPATVNALENSNNSGGWTLAIAYSNPNMLTYSMTIFVGCERAGILNDPLEISGFCTPSVGPVSGRLFASADDGDYIINGIDQLRFGPTNVLTSFDAQSGTNNPVNNFFNSQLNTYLPLTNDAATGKLVALGSSVLDTRGSYGLKNYPITAVFPDNFARTSWDITSVDVSSTLFNGQTTAYAQGTTTNEIYTMTSLALQVAVESPILKATKTANGQTSLYAAVGDTVTFNFSISNEGTLTASNSVFTDILETGLSFVPGTFKINGVFQPDPNLNTGVSLGSIAPASTVTLEFKVLIDSLPVSSNYSNVGNISYDFMLCGGDPLLTEAATNTVTIFFTPVANPSIGTTLINTPLNGANVLNNDVGVGLIVIAYSQGSQGGTVTMSPYGTYVYTPPLNFVGVDVFTYTAQDIYGNQISTTVTITVVATNIPPYGNDDSYNTLVNVPVSANVLVNDSSTLITIQSYTQGFQGGVVLFDSFIAGNFTYTPPFNFVGVDTFTYTAIDALNNPVTQTVYVTMYEDIPIVARPDFGVTYLNTLFNGPSVLKNDSGNLLTVLSYTQGTQGGTVSVDILGTYTYMPPLGFLGQDTFTYTAQDVFGNTATAIVTVTVVLIDPPRDFVGTIEKCKLLNKINYQLRANWQASTAPGIVSYRIYYKGEVVATIPANGRTEFVYHTCLPSKKAAASYEIAAVNQTNNESERVQIRIIHE